MNAPDISIVVPVYNRADLLDYSLESVRRASGELHVEVIVVDDGSTPPLDPKLPILGMVGARVIRQSNRGLLFARLAGLAAATGKYVLFLDSDDLVSSDMFAAQVAALEASGAAVSYCRTGRCVLNGPYDRLAVAIDPAPEITTSLAEFFIRVQPAPHSPVWERHFVCETAFRPLFPPSSNYNAVAEIWFYHNAAVKSGKAIFVPGATAIVGTHPGARLTRNWEKLGIASLAVMEAFARATSDQTGLHGVRQLVAEKAFNSWRRLPRDFSPEFCRRMVNLWQTLHREVRLDRLGGRWFQRLAFVIGPPAAAQIMRRMQIGLYEDCRTLNDEQFRNLLASIPQAVIQTPERADQSRQ